MEWAKGTVENNQSEFLQLFGFVVLSSVLVFVGSPQSKDGDEAMRADLKEIKVNLASVNRFAAEFEGMSASLARLHGRVTRAERRLDERGKGAGD